MRAVAGVRNLETRDILGAQVNTRSVSQLYFVEKRPEQIRAVRTDDIEGAVADSVHRGIRTIRSTNPLQPRY